MVQFENFQIGRYASVRVNHGFAGIGGGLTPGQEYQRSKALRRAQQQGAGDSGWIIPGQKLSRYVRERARLIAQCAPFEVKLVIIHTYLSKFGTPTCMYEN